MKSVLGMQNDEIAQTFEEWNKGELDSFLIEITANIIKFKDEKGEYLLDKIRDTAGQKGTGKWTAISALQFGIPVTLIGEAVFARCLSALKSERVQASEKIQGPNATFNGDKGAMLVDLRHAKGRYPYQQTLQALYAAKIISYA